ncbi:hypothetical protein Q0Z83_038970 [Actinoplanes sichuanensis]|uniref:Uncharacterized protein n=1 Tax=Actinoplanes sichuanensis TaxID=512349 RepID=A0ABW4AS12_9ACTN|nr:hypothetical protein [Actinoplanes sichuanensis]BEL05706.1 hypothetical protein Q0Z83_038970 [Actinoplanes sichuanensis]
MFELRPTDLGRFLLVVHVDGDEVIVGRPLVGGESGVGTDDVYDNGIVVAVFDDAGQLGLRVRWAVSSRYASRPDCTGQWRYVSGDGGRTWREVADEDTAPFDTEPVTSLRVHGANGWNG